MPQYVTVTDQYVFFWRGWPAQWYPSQFVIDGITYSCAEQYMMAEKARFFMAAHGDNADILKRIMATDKPLEQKDLGGTVKGFVDSEWVKVAREVVYRGNVAKFSQNEKLREYLLDTGDRIMVEASPIDLRWGIGLAADDPRARDPQSWRGTNWLGEAIMRARSTMTIREQAVTGSVK